MKKGTATGISKPPETGTRLESLHNITYQTFRICTALSAHFFVIYKARDP